MRARFLPLLLLLLAVPVLAEDRPAKGLRYPSLLPDGKRVAFCYRGDLWVGPLDGKAHADRLTVHEEQDTLCRASPDGTKIAFSSKRYGNYDIFVVPVDGGMPEQVTFHSGVEIVCAWSPDGKRILFTSNRDADSGRLDLYEVDLAGGTPRRITRDGGREGAYSPDGSQIVYVRGFNDLYWDNYTGSANYDLHVVPAAGGTPKQLTDTEGNERFPFFSADGASVYFVAEEEGVANFYSMPLSGGARTRLTKYAGDDVQRPDLSWDRKTVVFERSGQLFTADLAAPAEAPTPVPVAIRSDVRNSGLEARTITSGGEQVHLSADGRTCVFALRGDIWTMPSAGGNAKQVTSGPDQDQWPRLSPDGTKVAYFSNKAGNNDLFVHDLRTGKSEPLTRHPAPDFFHNWSPDGKKLVFTSERSGNREIWLLEIASQSATQLTNDPSSDDDACFSPDGRLIAFDSGRGGAQGIYVMNVDGSGVRPVGEGGGFFQVPSFSPDGKMLVFEGTSPASGQSDGLFVAAIQGGPSMRISRDGSAACWSPAGDFIYFAAERGPGTEGIYRVPAPASIHAGERVPFVGTVQVDLRKELGELFDEAWRALDEGFYDPKMHKVDWKAMKKKYRDIAVDAENKDEFHNVVRQMLAELGASHLGISGGPTGGRGVTPPVEQTGVLGIEFEEAAAEGGGRKVGRVLVGGPADQAGLRVGDVVTTLGTAKLAPETNLDKVLTGTAGKDLAVTYRPRSETGLGEERTAKLQPIDGNRLRELNYANWTAECARRVERATKSEHGNVGYVHLDQMNGPNLQKFQKQVAEWNKDDKVLGMVLDIRDNGGGNIHNQLIEILSAKPLAKVRMRGRDEMVTQPALYWARPVVVLINERSFSDAEVFPHMFRAAGIGKLVGVPTAGGVIGTNDITLSDGSRFRVPRTGFWSMDGTNLEGLGVEPDHTVEETPEDRLTGRDPQLDKAIEVVLAEVNAKREADEARKKAEAGKKPAPRPQPEAEPGTQQPEVKATAQDPLRDAQAGEWVRYRARMPGQAEDTLLRITVARVAEGVVHFTKEVEKGEHAVPALPDQVRQAPVVESLAAFAEVVDHSMAEDRLRDAAVEVCRVRAKWPDGSEVVLHFTNAVPAYGLWKVERAGETILEALEWGAKEAAPGAAAGVPPSPMYDARVGEWIRFRAVGRDGQEAEQMLKVAEVTDDEIVLHVTMTLHGESRDMPPLRRPRTRELKAPPGYEAGEFGTDTITAAGQSFDCVTMTGTGPGGAAFKWWYCPTVPATGLVRVERDGEVQLEVLAFGED